MPSRAYAVRQRWMVTRSTSTHASAIRVLAQLLSMPSQVPLAVHPAAISTWPVPWLSTSTRRMHEPISAIAIPQHSDSCKHQCQFIQRKSLGHDDHHRYVRAIPNQPASSGVAAQAARFVRAEYCGPCYRSEIARPRQLSGATSLSLNATANNTKTTTAQAGRERCTAIAGALAMAIVTEDTLASVGSGVLTLTGAGNSHRQRPITPAWSTQQGKVMLQPAPIPISRPS